MDSALKPCPFCGEMAETDFIPEHHSYRIECSMLMCIVGPSLDTEEAAIAAWNRRTFPAPAGEPEMPEAIAYARDWFAAGETPKKEKNANGRLAWPRRFLFKEVSRPRVWPEDVPIFTADQLRAYGDARAEHARRVAPGLVLMPEEMTGAMEDAAHEAAYIWRHTEWRAAERARYAAIRAAAPPQGEQA